MTPLEQLLLAKAESDRRNFQRKRQILQRLIRQAPQDFVVDQPHPKYPGITHRATGFRIHAPRDLTRALKVAGLVSLSRICGRGMFRA